MNKGEKEFLTVIQADISGRVKHNKTSVENLAKKFGVTDQNQVKEITELAIVKISRDIAQNPALSQEERFGQILDLYKSQVNLSHRTSQSVMLQQYSTPAPIGFLAGMYCDPQPNKILFEPSAGNGLLTIAWKPGQCYVNEIDQVRRDHLITQGFAKAFDQDATKDFDLGEYGSFFQSVQFDAVITNPPFGTMDTATVFDKFPIKTLEHQMALNALRKMKDTGKAVIIIGGHTKWDELGRIQAGKNRLFFNYLYHFYNVEDMIHIDGHALYSRMGTAFDTRMILINGRKANPSSYAPLLKDTYETPEMRDPVTDYWKLYERITNYSDMKKQLELEALALQLELELLAQNGLAGPYMPSSESCIVLDTQVPDSMDFETHQALARVKKAVGGSVDDYVLKKLGYASHIELCKALAAEQVDTVAMAIYNIEERNQAIIIGDQTGIGKGRQAAAMIRYAIKSGKKPIFLTEKANLFSDLYRDLVAIGGGQYVPFIVNAKDEKSNIMDENGKVIYKSPEKNTQDAAFTRGVLPSGYDYILATYSQFNKNKVNDNGLRETDKKGQFLYNMARDNVIIMDESHNSSGTSNTGAFLQDVLVLSKGVVFLSATFAKRPDNMPVYAMKTAMMDANMTSEQLVEAILKGGVALQEVIASQLVNEGQMVRRERSFKGVEVNYISLNEKEAEHSALADNITQIIREIINFQEEYVGKTVEQLDKISAAESAEVTGRKGTEKGGVDNTPYFSKIFNVINQMLFSVKAEAVADQAIKRLQEGKKPVIAFANTMGAFLDDMGVGNGDVIEADFSYVLRKGLEGVMKITKTQPNGEKEYDIIKPHELGPAGQAVYMSLSQKIDNLKTGLAISPIDVIRQKIEQAGYKVAEVTGRKYELQLNRFGAKIPEQSTSTTAKKKTGKLKLSDIPAAVRKIMPAHQQSAIVGSEEHWDTIKKLNDVALSIPKIGGSEKAFIKAKEEAAKHAQVLNYADFATVKLRYWLGDTEWWITEWDGDDEVYCFVVLNGDWQNAEFGYNSLKYMFSHAIKYVKIELDFHWHEKTVRDAINKAGGGDDYLHGFGDKPDTKLMALVMSRDRMPTNEAFRKFNDNEFDVLMINQSGSTGASAHAIVTPKVPREKIKQRVMIILQAELNINTEVQKRGRINRTGQLIKPIYDYINSAIPAEQRLMMMLKKKLKSLDANTSSNQKQSEKLLDGADFLNKYGDEIVYQYVAENPTLNMQLGELIDKDDLGKEPGDIAGFAHKASGRVAILPVKQQKAFYDEVILRYTDYVDYLQQTGEYDLEVETLDLQAKVLESKSVKIGKSPNSVFGADSILEKIEVNILRKPFTQAELHNMIEQAKNGDTPENISANIIKDFFEYSNNKLNLEIAEINKRTQLLLDAVSSEKKINSIEDPQARQLAIQFRKTEITEGMSAKLVKVNADYLALSDSLNELFEFFTIGRALAYPRANFEGVTEKIPAVCLGVVIDKKRDNPYAPSAIKVKIAIGNSLKYIAFNAGPKFMKELGAIRGASYNITPYTANQVINHWDEHTKKATAPRGIRYVITGNLLQAYSSYKGNLVSFTMQDGSEQKGILMPDHWQTGERGEPIQVPISKAAKFVKSLTTGSSFIMNGGDISILRQYDNFKLFTSASKAKGGRYFLDQDILNIARMSRFDKVADKMVAVIDEGYIDQLIEILQLNHSASVYLNDEQFAQIADSIEKVKPKEIHEMPHQDDDEMLMLELEAEALLLELELMQAA